MIGLYPLCDVDALARVGLLPLPFVRALLAADPLPALIQLRAKSWSKPQILELLSELVPLMDAAGVPLVVNDHPDLAITAGAALVHVGQQDGEPGQVPYGRSTHSLEQLERALAASPRYVAYGPVFTTASKKDHEPAVGIDGLRAAHVLTRAKGIPLCAIGGIDAHRLAAVAPHCELLAVIGALLHPELDVDPASRAARAGQGVDAVTERASQLGRALALHRGRS